MQTSKVFLVGLLIVSFPGLTMGGPFFSPGEPNSWDNTTAMTETAVGSGIWEYTWTGFNDSEPPTKFDILSVSGDWGSKVHPAGNQWITPDSAGGNTLSLDENTYADGWSPETHRVGVASELASSWTAVGNWQNQVGGGDWDNGNPSTAMMDDGGGIHWLTVALSEGTYQYKAVVTGTWDAIGASSRNVNSHNLDFSVPAGATSTTFEVNVLDGTIRVQHIPEPATLSLAGLGVGALLLSGRRRKR